MDSGGNADTSTWKIGRARAFFFKAGFLASFFTLFAPFLCVRLAILQVYQKRSLSSASHIAMPDIKRPRRVKYRLGLSVTVSLLLAGALGLVVWATLANTRTAIIQLTDEHVRELLTDLEVRVRDHLQHAVTEVQLSERELTNRVLREDRETLARHFIEVLRANPTFAWASYSDEMGDFTGAYRAPNGSLHISQTSLKNGGALVDATVGEDATWLRHYEETANDYDPRDEAFYKAAKQGGTLVWIGPVIFYDEGLPGITCANPRRASDGHLLGVLTVDFDLNFLSEFTGRLRFGKHGKVFIFDKDRHVIAYPGVRLIENAGHGSEGKLLTEADVPDPVLHAFIAHDANRVEEQFTFYDAGQPFVGAYHRLNVDSGPSWFLGAYAPESDFLSVLVSSEQAAVAIAVSALCCGLLLTMILARRISVPLTKLASEMEEVGNFQLSLRPPMGSIFKEVAAMDEALLLMKGSLRSFSYYVPRDLVRTMLQSGQEATLQGQTREMTVYFSDIAGMTPMAETMSPDELVQLLSRYFDEMTQIIAFDGGTVDKFIGDAIMAFWGAPVPTADHAGRASSAALRSQRKLAQLRTAHDIPGLANIHMRVGIATGDVLVGNVGSHDRFNYTVMGDIVNLASRLEGLNKMYGTEILIADRTYQAAREHVVARPVGVVQVKGKRQHVQVWEPLCLTSEDDADARELAALFEQGLAAYLARDFQGAVEFYQTALRLRPNDRPAAVLLGRCRESMLTPPPGEWDGVYVATEK